MNKTIIACGDNVFSVDFIGVDLIKTDSIYYNEQSWKIVCDEFITEYKPKNNNVNIIFKNDKINDYLMACLLFKDLINSIMAKPVADKLSMWLDAIIAKNENAPIFNCDLYYHMFEMNLLDYKNYLHRCVTGGSNVNPFAIVKRTGNYKFDKKIKFIEEYNYKDLKDDKLFEKKYTDRILTHYNNNYTNIATNIYAYEELANLQHIPHILHDNDYWKCENHTKVPRYDIGQRVFCSKNEFIDKFNSITGGIFTNFNWKNATCSGGLISQMLETYDKKYIHRVSDIDIFVYGNEKERTEKTKYVLEHLNNFAKSLTKTTNNNIWYCVRGSVVDVYILDFPRKIQIVISPCRSPLQIVRDFDITNCKVFYENGNVYGTSSAIKTFEERLVRFEHAHHTKNERVVKQLMRGFDVKKDRVILELIDITELIKNTKTPEYRSCIQSITKFYYPRSDYSFDAEELEDNIISQLKSESGSNTVSSDFNVAYEKTLLGVGGINTSYNTKLYSSMNFDNITPFKFLNHHNMLNFNNKPIKLTTDEQKVVSCTFDDDKHTCTLSVELKPEFRNFLIKIQREIREKCKGTANLGNRAIPAYVDIIDNINNKYEVILPYYRVNKNNSGNLLKDRLGKILSVEKNLVPGCTVQITFEIMFDYVMKNTTKLIAKRIFLMSSPQKIIYNDDTTTNNNEKTDTQNNNQNLTLLSNSINNLNKNVNVADNKKYDYEDDLLF